MTDARLPDASWRHDAGMVRLIATLGGPDSTRIVGGAVRDTIAGLAVGDVDLATRLRPDAVLAALADAGIKAVPTGIAHGTVTAVIDGQAYEVTTLRRDVATDGRRATVAFTDDWAEDAARRDFTINALYADPASGVIFDPVGGLADLAAGRVRFIGDAGARIDEDHLRILRWFRFQARYGRAGADPADVALIAARAPQLRSLSRERVADELMRLLALPDPTATIALMHDTGVLGEILPECDAASGGRLAALVGAEAALGVPVDAVRRLVALLPPDAVLAEKAAARLKMANRVRQRIIAAHAPPPPDGDTPRALAYRIGPVSAQDRLMLADPAAARAGLDALKDWEPPRLPVSGGDIVALGVAAGPEVARLLRATESRWIADGFPDRAATLAIARQLAAE